MYTKMKRKGSGRRLPPRIEKALPTGSEGENFFFRAVDVSESPEAPDREFEDIILRRVPRAVAHRFRGGAGARALTHAQYLAALLSLHEGARQRADAGDKEMTGLLRQLGLQTVSI